MKPKPKMDAFSGSRPTKRLRAIDIVGTTELA
jgi:hypothetical protein